MTEKDLIVTRQVLENWSEEVLASMRSILIESGKSATGELIQSLRYTIDFEGEEVEVEFEMADYGQFVDSGRRPGKQPPISSIQPWLAIRGIPFSAAFPIARSIGLKGIPATPFFGISIERNRDRLVQELADAYAQDIENYITAQFK